MTNLDDLVRELKARADAVRLALQQARADLEVLDRRITELARKELHHGC